MTTKRTRRSNGEIIETETKTKGTSYAMRFYAYGKRYSYTLGTTAGGCTREDADRELAYVVEQVHRGVWVPPELAQPPKEITCPTFGDFAAEWITTNRIEWSKRTIESYTYRLSHLLPTFGNRSLLTIKKADVDAYRREKLEDAKLSPNTVNATIKALRQILEDAVEAEWITANPASGRKRLAKTKKPNRPILDSAEKIAAVVDSAGRLPNRTTSQQAQDRALIATLVYAGPRIGEALALKWSDVDLAHGRLYVRGTKTDAANRKVNLEPVLLGILKDHAAHNRPKDDNLYLFATGTGAPLNDSNSRSRILKPALEIASRELEAQGLQPTGNVTFHGLRRTYASWLCAVGKHPGYVADQMGHESAVLSMDVYRQTMHDQGLDKVALEDLIAAA